MVVYRGRFGFRNWTCKLLEMSYLLYVRVALGSLIFVLFGVLVSVAGGQSMNEDAVLYVKILLVVGSLKNK